ncbi:hypothetical protein BV392_11605 [Rhodovulum sulfidophilum]|nr:hypothetical protein BV392_11605 [Rhodovulum sulfidophilum]
MRADAAMSGGEGESVDVFLRPLWPGVALPVGLARQYERLRSFWKDDAPVWTFWQSWYKDMLAGRPVDWDFLRQVVLLPNKDWEAGPERIASLIGEMRPEVSPEPVRRDLLERQAARLVRKAAVMEVTAAGVAALIDETVLEYLREARTNCLPDEFLLLNTIPPILRRIASEVGHSAAAGSGGALPAELARLKARVVELEAELSALRARSSRGLFSKALCEAAGKSLGDWKMWAALIGGCYVLLGDPVLTDRLPSLASTVRGLFPAPDVPYPSDVVMPPPGIDI